MRYMKLLMMVSCFGILFFYFYSSSKLINKAYPETIDERSINMRKPLSVYKKIENQNLAINAARGIGCIIVNIGPNDLINGTPHLVLGILWQILKQQLLSHVTLIYHPELYLLSKDDEAEDVIYKLPPQDLLLRWLNYHLHRGGYDKEVTNYHSDLMDIIPYTILLPQVAPQYTPEPLASSATPMERANWTIDYCRKIDIETFIHPEDMVNGVISFFLINFD